MKQSFLMLVICMSAFISSASSCNNDDNHINPENSSNMQNGKIKITVNKQTFTASLLNNRSAQAFREMLPLTITMVELNGNEKYYDLPNILPTNQSNPVTIKNGDLMLYGSRTLVLFYSSFPTSYSYTKLGAVDDVTGLATALGSGNVTIIFEIE